MQSISGIGVKETKCIIMLRVAIVSYLNTRPFLHGLLNQTNNEYDLLLIDPAACAEAYKANKVDIALVPVGALMSIGEYQMITDFCIGCDQEVRTVCLMSNQIIHDIDTIYLDNQSRTSAVLIQVLMKHHFKHDCEFIHGLPEDFILQNGCGMLLIGDKVFDAEKRFAYTYDLGTEWLKFTSLPFVFAVWVAKKHVTHEQISNLNRTFNNGIQNYYSSTEFKHLDEGLKKYYTQNISYVLDEQKIKGMALFLKYMIN